MGEEAAGQRATAPGMVTIHLFHDHGDRKEGADHPPSLWLQLSNLGESMSRAKPCSLNLEVTAMED